jgi:predicted HicB family RNase H-like nuclease
MKIYFYSPQATSETSLVSNYLKQAGVSLVSNLSPVLKKNKDNNEGMLKVDALLILAKNLDTQAAYLLALVLAQNRPVLCLLPKGVKIDATLENLSQQANFAKKLQISFYASNDLKTQLISWLQTLDQANLRNLFNIKYTLRLSGKISDYLNWKANNVKMSGADWLRQLIQENMDNDTAYQTVLKNKYKLN